MQARRGEQREVALAIHSKHPHAPPADRNGTVNHVCHRNHAPVRNGEAGGDAVTGAHAQRHDTRRHWSRRGASAGQDGSRKQDGAE